MAPDICTWRGGGLDCNGQCHTGEVALFYSKKGGGPASESGEKKCNRGNKVFCCEDRSFRDNVVGCYWADCSKSGNCGDTEVAKINNGACGYAAKPTRSRLFKIATGSAGETAPTTRATTTSLYDCPPDLFEDPDPPDYDDTLAARHLQELELPSVDHEARGLFLDKRAERRSVNARVWDPILGIYLIWRLYARRYPGPSTIYRGPNGRPAYENAIRPQGGTCGTTAIEKVRATGGNLPNPNSQPEEYQNDHPIELQYFADFLTSVTSGMLPNGVDLPDHVPPIGADVLGDWWFDETRIPRGKLPRPAPRALNAYDRWSINDRLCEILGSNYNHEPFRMLHGGMNIMKGNIFGGNMPVSLNNVANHLNAAVETGSNEEDFLLPLRQILAIYRYLFDQDVLPQIQRQRRQIRRQLDCHLEVDPAADATHRHLEAFRPGLLPTHLHPDAAVCASRHYPNPQAVHAGGGRGQPAAQPQPCDERAGSAQQPA
ncbi:hypothetical protein B0H66DRAFT_589196 [Apodospora peruviana]|uniref:Uncharacterized protein n=1 Tax=Apodospora peruviana TaxID=516989 RepID=A0AAE0IK39_9PEZI|nr:hypothetical protein B0H66DRAFT_589196 [Apodospora peruviana]